MFTTITDKAAGCRSSERGKRLTSRIVTSAVLGSILIGAAACSSNESKTKQHTQFVDWRGADQPMVLSGSPSRDTRANALADSKLEEADWRILESLGPKAIWERLEELGKRSRDKRAASATSPAATRPSSASMLTAHKTPTTQPESPREIPVVTLPDGKIRMIYRLRHYGGTTVTTAVDGGTQRRSVVPKAPDLAPLVAVLATNLGDGGTVVPLPDENALIVTCVPTMKDPVVKLLDTIDRPPRQVEITAKMFEVSHDFDFQYGTQLLLQRLATDNSQSLASTFSSKSFANAVQNTATGGAADPASGNSGILRLMRVFQDAGISVDVTFQLMAETGLINVVAAPRMTVAAGQTGYMLAGQELPIQQVAIVNSAQQTSTTYKPVGVQLYITPQALGPDTVKLHAISIVSSVQGFSPVPNLNNEGQPNRLLINPILESREAQTSVTLENGSTLVFGGLRMIKTTSREAKIPGLGDIPGLGWLFKNHRSQKQMTDLYFFVTPTLLDSQA